MSRQRFPFGCGQPGASLEVMRVTGASVGTTAGTAGLDGRGKFLCNISKGTGGTSNQVTVTYLTAYADTPYLAIKINTANCAYDVVSQSATGFVINTVTRDAHATPINNADFEALIICFNTDLFVS